MTETTVAVITNPPRRESEPGSIGVVLPNTEAKVSTVHLQIYSVHILLCRI